MQRKLNTNNKKAPIYGLLFINNSDTIGRTPLLTILISDGNILGDIFYHFDFQYNLSNSGKKDGTFLCNRFIKHMEKRP